MVAELGGPDLPAVGFGLGLERLLLLLDNLEIDLGGHETVDLFIGHIGEKADMFVQKLALDLRKEGVSVSRDYMGRSVKAQMKYADKIGARFTMVLGDDEIEAGHAKVKNMETGETTEVRIDSLGTFSFFYRVP